MRESDLTVLADRQAAVLRLISAGIWRKKEMNATGLHGAAATVHAVEWVLALGDAYVKGDQDEFDNLMESPKI